MAKLHYVTVTSLDGYIGDKNYNWGLPAEGSTAFITEVMRPIGTYLYGRGNFETMSFWETPDMANLDAEHLDFVKVWQAAEKIVFSKTLKTVSGRKTRLENNFDVQKIREMKSASDKDLCIGGANIAGQALRNKLVDEIHLFVVPTTIGDSIPVIPVLPRDLALNLKLLEERRFSEDWLYLRYAVQI